MRVALLGHIVYTRKPNKATQRKSNSAESCLEHHPPAWHMPECVALLGHIIYTRKPNKATCRATMQMMISRLPHEVRPATHWINDHFRGGTWHMDGTGQFEMATLQPAWQVPGTAAAAASDDCFRMIESFFKETIGNSHRNISRIVLLKNRMLLQHLDTRSTTCRR